jgi:hypothetical protein
VNWLLIEVIKEVIKHTGYKVTRYSAILPESTNLNSVQAIVTLQSRDIKQKFFMKMARTCRDSKRILHEIEILRKLQNMKVENIPEVILSGACDGRAYIVENFIEESLAPHPLLSGGKMLSSTLEWIRRFYSQTKSGIVEPKELIQRAERVNKLANGFIDLTDALHVLEKSEPHAKIPAVCRHGDIANVNFILTSRGMVAVNFGFARFDEPPSEPYALVSPAKLKENTRCLDVLLVFDGVDPFFFAMYENIIRLGEKLRMLHELEENLLVTNRIGYFSPRVQLENIEKLKLYYQESVMRR